MAEPERQLRLLRELRDDIKTLDPKVDALDNKVDRNHEDVKERIYRLRQAMVGESILGRYATAEFEERLSSFERQVSDVEEQG